MKAQELRIGNIIQWDNDRMEVEVINAINEKCIGLESDIEFDTLSPVEFFKPIPLTEEWLLKFGFTNHDDYEYFIELRNIGIPEYFNIYKGNTCYGIADYDTEIRYVHQLQNLFFALTGIELTIK